MGGTPTKTSAWLVTPARTTELDHLAQLMASIPNDQHLGPTKFELGGRCHVLETGDSKSPRRSENRGSYQS